MPKDQTQNNAAKKDDIDQTMPTAPVTDPTVSSEASVGQSTTDQSAIPAQTIELETAKKQLENAKKQIHALTATAKRALADLENYRRRSEEEKADFIQFANAKLILELLPLADNFKLANDWVKGVTQIEKQLIDFLEKQGLQEIKAIGQPFNANLHEAMLQGPGEKDIIIEVFQKGYRLGDRVLRPAKVKVGTGEIPSSESPPPPSAL